MEDLEKLKERYIQDVRATKITTLQPYDLRDTKTIRARKQVFRRWAKQMNFRQLVKQTADFALDEDIIRQFGIYRHRLSTELGNCFLYLGQPIRGRLVDIGSCWDGSKIGRVNEMDSNYIVDTPRVVLKRNPDNVQLYHSYLDQDGTLTEIKPREITEALAQHLEALIAATPLPECLKHGGYRAPTYSGLRYNGPAATAQFLTANENFLLTWDVAVSFPVEGDIRDIVRRRMAPIIEANRQKMFPPAEIHVVGDMVENLWKLSTGHLEAEMLRVLANQTPVKKALSDSKAIASTLQACSREEPWLVTASVGTATTDITGDLDRFSSQGQSDDGEHMELGRALNFRLRYAHIWIPCTSRKKFNESDKNHISINTAAMKHIILREGLSTPGAFSPKTNSTIVTLLTKKVFQTLSDETLTSEHAFLDTEIGHFSVSATMKEDKDILVRDVQDQCAVIASDLLGVSYILVHESFGCSIFMTFIAVFCKYQDHVKIWTRKFDT